MSERPVLYVLKRFPRLSETFVLHELLGLEAAGDHVLIDSLLPPEDGPYHPELADLRAEVRYLPRYPRLRQAAVAAVHLRWACRYPRRWARLALRARRPDEWRRFLQAGLVAERVRRAHVVHIHAHFATVAAEVARDAGALAGVPVTVTAHAKDIFHIDNTPHLVRRLDGVAGVVTVSRFNAAYLTHVLPATPVHYVPNGVPTAAVAPCPPGGPILTVGRLVPKKGIDTLIDAVALAARNVPGLHLEVVGGGPERAALEARAAAQGLGDRVTFLGPLSSDGVAAAFQRCSMVVLACRVGTDGDRDGMPTVLVEAMARALPVIATDIVGIPELVRHGETGMLVPPDDATELAAAITHLASDPAYARSLGCRAQQLVADQYDPGQCVDRLRLVMRSATR